MNSPFSLPLGWRIRVTWRGKLVLQRHTKKSIRLAPGSWTTPADYWVDAKLEDITAAATPEAKPNPPPLRTFPRDKR